MTEKTGSRTCSTPQPRTSTTGVKASEISDYAQPGTYYPYEGSLPCIEELPRRDGAPERAALFATVLLDDYAVHGPAPERVPEALDAATRAERARVLALAGQMLHQCAGWHSTMGRRLEALIEDIKCGARPTHD